MPKKPTVAVEMSDTPHEGWPAQDVPPPGLPTPLEPEILQPLAKVRFESRIRILEAWRYPGQLYPPAGEPAPDWIDPSWIGWADWDPVRNIEAGPCLRIPMPGNFTGICRIGDYVTRQETVAAAGEDGATATYEEVTCWPKDQFERLFIATSERASGPLIKRDRRQPPEIAGN